MRIKALIVVVILITSASALVYSGELAESTQKAHSPNGNMPKNIAETGDVGKYASIKVDSLNNPHITFYYDYY